MTHEPLARANILIVDDKPANLMALRAVLEPLGQNLVEASSGGDALRLLDGEGPFAAILLDVQMPELDGVETAILIKQREKTRHIPILFLTAAMREDLDIFKGYAVGAVDYLIKPVEPDILRAKVAVFLELHRRDVTIRRQAELLRERRDREIEELRRASEQRYRDLADSMPQIVWTSTDSGIVVYRNRRWYECAGLGDLPEQPLGWEAVLHPEDLAAFEDRWERALKSGEDWEGEFRFGSRAKGVYCWHLVRVLHAKDAQGRGSWIGTSTDIDDRKRAEQALRLLVEVNAALATFAEPVAVLERVARAVVPILGDACAIAVTDLDGRCSRAAVGFQAEDRREEALGVANRALDEVAETGARLVIPVLGEAARPREAALLWAMDAVGIRAAMGFPIVSQGCVLGAVSFMLRAQGPYLAFQVRLAEDVARRIGTAVEAEHLRLTSVREQAQLATANRAKDEFLAVLSHELRTPLNAILGWAEVVRRGDVDAPTLSRAMETIHRNAEVQAQLIADLLDVSCIASGKLAVELRPVRLRSAVEHAVDAARPAAAAAGVTLETDYGLQDEEVHADLARLQQVVGNLVSNAIKFTPQAGRVRILLERDGPQARLVVEDNGKGIEPSFLPHVFERFRQADEPVARAHRGLGLGLAIVHHLVEAHEGEVEVASDGPGKGARFTVKLAIHERDARVPLVGARLSVPDEVADRALGGLRLLIVEDDDDGREIIELMLRRSGASVKSVSTAEAALEALQGEIFDVLVSDIGLPAMDGYALVKRAHATRGPLPAIALTAYVSRDDRARALAAGFDVHIPKPVEPHTLVNAVAAVARPTADNAPN
jgi:PAS domain S-box-containing protein